MDWRHFVRTRLTDITGDPARDEEIVEELAQHLAARYDELCGGGATPDRAMQFLTGELHSGPALAAAIRRADRQRAAAPVPPPTDGTQLLGDLWLDTRYAVRLLWRHPGFAAAALLTLALGIGMTASIFSVVQAVLLRPVPFPDSGRLLMVWETDRDSGTMHEPAAVPDYFDFKRRSRQVDRLGAFASGEVNLVPAAGDPVRVSALGVTADFVELVGVRPLAGRVFLPEEDRPGASNVVMISDRLARDLFGGSAMAVGGTIRLNDVQQTIVGIVPAAADFGVLQILSAADYARGFADRDVRTRVDVWTPLRLDPGQTSRDNHGLLMVGRLAPGATAASAQRDLAGIAADLERIHRSNEARGVLVEPLEEVIFGRVETALTVLMGAVSLVLLIACVNVANLLLARGTARFREVALRAAVGAEMPRLARQFMVENVVLTLVAAGLGMLLAYGTLVVLVAVAPANIPRLASVALDLRVLLLTLGMSAGVGLVFGLFPLFQGRDANLQSALKADDSRGATAGRDGQSLRSALVIVEIALAVVLLTGAGLVMRSFWQIQQTDPGFDVSGVLKAEFELPASRYPTAQSAAPGFAAYNRFTGMLLERVRALPGVEAAAVTAHHPLDSGFASGFRVVGREAEAANWPELSLRHVTADYFRTLRVPLVRGRFISDADTSQSMPVVVVNQAVARRFFPDQDPIGHQIFFWGRAWTVVGIVGNEKFDGITSDVPIAAYAPLPQTRFSSVALLVRTSVKPADAIPAVHAAIRGVDPELAVFGMEPLAETLSNSLAEQRFLVMLLGLFAFLALTLASIGVHGVLSYVVAQRTREIGVRIALGASAGRVVRMVVAHGAVLAVAGLAIGVLASLGLARVLSGLLFEVSPNDPITLAATVLVLAAVAGISIWLPARRAVRVDPLVALRQE